ncbi:MAG: FIST N-terminal domain-containing protein [candidate division WOR-3 bacterium]
MIFLSDSFWKKLERGPAEARERRIKAETEAGLERWLGTGYSAAEKPFLAGVEAAREAQEKIGGKNPSLILCFIGGAYDYKTVLSGVAQVMPAPIVGAEAPGGLFNEDVVAGRGVLVAAFSFEENRFALGIGGGFVSSTDKALSGALGKISEAEAQARADGYEHAGLYIIAPNSYPLVGEALFSELSRLSDTFEVISAGILGKVNEPGFVSVFWEGDTYSDHLIAIAVFSKTPLSMGMGHGFHPICPLKVTLAKGNLIKELDDQPVDWALREVLGKRGINVSELSNPTYADEVLPRYQLAIAHPEFPGKFRAFLPLSLEKGGLRTNAIVEEGSTVWFMEASEEEMLESVDRGVKEALIRTRGAKVMGAMVNESVIRIGLLAEGYAKENELLRKHLAAPFFGVGTVEEIIITDGVYPAPHSGSLSLSLFTMPAPTKEAAR